MTGQSESYHLVKEDVKGGAANGYLIWRVFRRSFQEDRLISYFTEPPLLQRGHPYAILTKNVYLHKTLA